MTTDSSNQELGQFGEALAVEALSTHGYEIIEQNWRCKQGEIDIIAQDRGVWVFIEVKLRRGDSFGTPEDAITVTKQHRLLGCGVEYMNQIGRDDALWRIDIVAIELAASGKVQRLSIHQDAVRAH